MGRLLSSYEVKQARLKKTLRITNRVVAIFFCLLGAFILFFNVFNLIGKWTSNSTKSNDFAFVDNHYFVPVTSDAWAKFYPMFSFLIVNDVNVDYEYLMIGEDINSSSDERMLHEKRMNDVYLVKIVDDEDVSYTVAKVQSKVIDGVVFEGGVYVSYDCVLGVVENSIPLISIFQNLIFILAYLFLLVLYVAILIIFSYSDIGFDMLFEKEFRGEIRKNKAFAYETKDEMEDENTIKTDEEKVHDLIIHIISDSDGKNQDKDLPLINIENALKVLNEQNFSSKSKVYVYLASLNLLNAYVKSENCVEFLKNKYFFKKYVEYIVNYVHQKESEDVKIFTDGSVILLECLGMQFSFHGVKMPPEIIRKDWSGVRLQPYANQVFELLYEQEFLGYSFGEPTGNIKRYLELIKKEEK